MPLHRSYRVGQRVLNRDPSIGVTVGTLGTVIEIKGRIISVRWN
jgi:hypothetical protein